MKYLLPFVALLVACSEPTQPVPTTTTTLPTVTTTLASVTTTTSTTTSTTTTTVKPNPFPYPWTEGCRIIDLDALQPITDDGGWYHPVIAREGTSAYRNWAGQNIRMVVNTGQCLVFKFTPTNLDLWYSPGVPRAGNFVMEMDPIGRAVEKYVNISTSPADFSYSLIGLCGGSSAIPAMGYIVETEDSHSGKCSIRPNVTYYWNIRNESASYWKGFETCPENVACGFVFQLH